MSSRQRATSAALGLSIALGAVGCDNAPPKAPAASDRCAPSESTSDFELAVVGSGGPRGFGRAASSYLVFVKGKPQLLIDVGPGAFVRMGEMGVDFRKLDKILLTHLHIDHAGDLPGFVKSRDLTIDEPLSFSIFGPSGAGLYPSTSSYVDKLFGKAGAYAYLPSFRNELRLNATDLPTAAEAPIHEVVRDGELRVTSIAVDHDDVPAVAYRAEYGGHAVVVSGDLASKNDNLIRLARDADVLVYDAAVLDPPESPKNLYELHTAPARIGEVAAAAHVKTLVLSHIPPKVEEAEAEVTKSVRKSYRGELVFARDCLRIPAGRK